VPAYIGPGAGFALGGSFLFGLAGLILAFFAILAWPLRVAIRTVRGRTRRKFRQGKHEIKRVVVIGLDGLDPGITRNFLDSGDLPHLASLREKGTFRPLGTTYPSMSPVGWSTFATGVDASRHNIFDFLSRDKQTHLPVLSSTRLHEGRERKIGPLKLPGGGSHFELLRRSKPFWKTCAEQGIPSTILRVPITFPPDKFGGKLLSAMCVPDLRGTQGTFSHYSEPALESGSASQTTGGVRLTLENNGPNSWKSHILGPDIPGTADNSETMTLPVTVVVQPEKRCAEFSIGKEKFTLGENEYSQWLPLEFGSGMKKAHGICKVRITSFEPGFSFYVTPVHIDPRHPAMPISNPPHLAIAYSRLHGRFATLGLAEDTWALNERVIDEQAFLDQVYDIHAEREQQFFQALDRQE